MASSISTFTHAAWNKFHRSVFRPPEIPLRPQSVASVLTGAQPFEECAICFSGNASEYGLLRSTLLSHTTEEGVLHRFHLDCILEEVKSAHRKNWSCPFRCGCSVDPILLHPLKSPEYAGAPLAYPRNPIDRMKIHFPIFFPVFLRALATSARAGAVLGGALAPFLFIGSLGLPFWIRFPVKIFAGSLGGAAGIGGALLAHSSLGWPLKETVDHFRLTPQCAKVCQIALSIFLSAATFYIAGACFHAGTALALVLLSAPHAKIALFALNTFLKTAYLLSRLATTYFLTASLLS